MKFTQQDIKLFDEVFKSASGYVLDFSNRTMRDFFEEELSIDIDNEMYLDDGDSKAKRLRCFIKKTDRNTVLKVIYKLWVYRKLMTTDPVTARDEILYTQLVERINNTDIVYAERSAPSGRARQQSCLNRP